MLVCCFLYGFAAFTPVHSLSSGPYQLTVKCCYHAMCNNQLIFYKSLDLNQLILLRNTNCNMEDVLNFMDSKCTNFLLNLRYKNTWESNFLTNSWLYLFLLNFLFWVQTIKGLCKWLGKMPHKIVCTNIVRISFLGDFCTLCTHVKCLQWSKCTTMSCTFPQFILDHVS